VNDADAEHSDDEGLHDNENTASYKLSQLRFASFSDAASFALTILIFALETTSAPAFPEQALAAAHSDPASTVWSFSHPVGSVIRINSFVITPAPITLNFP